MTWSLAVLEILDEEAWNLFIEALQPEVLGMPVSQIPDEALSQIFQALMLMQVTKPEGKWDISDELRLGGRKSWLSNTKNVTISEFHSEVSRMLSSMGIKHEFEHLTEDRLFSVDIALSDEKIALEADGPHHFTANTLQPLADMYWRRTLLHARGWRVVSVPYYHWAGAEDEDRRALLRRLLSEVRAEPVPDGSAILAAPQQAGESAAPTELPVVEDTAPIRQQLEEKENPPDLPVTGNGAAGEPAAPAPLRAEEKENARPEKRARGAGDAEETIVYKDGSVQGTEDAS